MATGADFLTTKEGPGAGSGGAAVAAAAAVVVVVVVVVRAAVVVPELRVGHHPWRWNIDYFRIFRMANPLSIETLSIPSELLSPPFTTNKTRTHYNVDICHGYMAPHRTKKNPPGISQIILLYAQKQLIHLFDSFTQVLYPFPTRCP